MWLWIVVAVIVAAIVVAAVLAGRGRIAAAPDTTRSESERMRVERELTTEALSARVDTFQQH